MGCLDLIIHKKSTCHITWNTLFSQIKSSFLWFNLQYQYQRTGDFNWSSSCVSFLLVILFIYISNVISHPSFPSTNPLLPSPPTASMRVLSHLPTHLWISALAFPYPGSSNLHRTKGLPSQGCPIRLSSAKYSVDTYTIPHPMCTLWFVV